MKILVAIMIISLNVQAAAYNVKGDQVEFPNAHFMISDLTKSFASLNKLNVVFDSDFRDVQVTTVGPNSIHKDSLALYLSTMLSQYGYSMRVLPETNTLSIFNSRDVRYLIVDSYKDIEKVPDNYEYVQFMYELKHIPGDELVRSLRPFVGRYGRIIEQGNSILINDAGKNIKRIMKIVQEIDTLAYVQSATEIKELNEKNKKVIERKESFIQILSDNNIIFLILFSLIGGILGFGVRGYSMKRIEGGW